MNMRALAWVLMIAATTGCTERNPEYCGDGTCIDPGKPYCDVDGSFSGTPGTCIAVQCTPDEFAHCRDNIAITCSANGKNYDSVECPMGCAPAASGCIECTANAQCGGSTVCDQITNHCRGCQADDECDSRVCDVSTGSCVAENTIVYASPNGTGTCSLSQPCSLMTAVVRAENATPTPIVRMLPGSYTTSVLIDVPTAQPLNIVATGSTMVVVGDAAAIVVESGAKAVIRNLTSTSERQIQCGLASTTAPLSSVELSRSTLSMVGSGLGFETQRCALTVRNVDLTTSVDILATRNDSTIKVDGLYVHGSISSLIASGSRVSIDITNSVFDNAQLVGFISDTGPPGSSLKIAFSTLWMAGTSSICNGAPSPYFLMRFESAILGVQGAGDVFSNATACTFVSSLFTRQLSPPSGVTVADPKFVDLAARNFHLTSSSPAIDAASTNSTDHDIEGTPRPQGGKSDLGAYEYHP